MNATEQSPRMPDSVNCGSLRDVIFRLASNREVLEQAFSLAHETYVESGLMKPHSSGMRITPYLLFPQTSVIVAMRGESMVGTLATVRETPIGLPHFRLLGGRSNNGLYGASAEGSNFAVQPEYRSTRSPVTLALACYCAEYAMRFQRVDRLVAVVHPRHAQFYEGLLKYSRLAPDLVEHYDFVEGAPAIVDYIEPLDYPRKLFEAYDRPWEGADIFSFLFGANSPKCVFPERRSLKATDCIWTPELLNYFLHDRSNLWDELTLEQQQALRSAYWTADYNDVFGMTINSQNRPDCGFDVFALAHVESTREGEIHAAVLRNVSSASVTLHFPRRHEQIQVGEPIWITTTADRGDAVRLSGHVESADSGWSIEVRNKKHPIWNEVIERLEQDYFPKTDATARPVGQSLSSCRNP